ncbi:MAG: complex I NDUFA9 subunit family protein [Tistrella sp.]|nr:complex I NDUFA9 subunit family protein [Tistrella sp.]
MIAMKDRLVTVFGGSGFLGRYVVARLARTGVRIRVAVRDADRALFLKPAGDVGQIAIMSCDVTDAAQVRAALAEASAAINLTGILAEGWGATFDGVHVQGAGNIAKAAADTGLGALVHVSAIGADPESSSAYGRTKAAGEAAVREAFPTAVILRPSILFGPEDDFFNRFAGMTRISPALPLIGGGQTRFQPVWVVDVAEAVVRALDEPEFAGRTFELGGPKVYSFAQILEYILATVRKHRGLVPMPWALAGVVARFGDLLPGGMAPLTTDQLRMLKRDNVVAEGAEGFAAFGIRPTPVEAVVPDYLARYRAWIHRPRDGRAGN